MNKSVLKVLSVCLCATLAAGTSVYAIVNDKQGEQQVLPVSVSTKQKSSSKKQEITKDETVYVLAGANGSVQKIIVSDWIKNVMQDAQLHDESELGNIVNIKGDETYTMNGDTMRVWDAKGNDIYYQGDIKKDIPVEMSVSYTLDGKKVSPEELAGKSGHVVIRFDYQNNQFANVKINGKTEKVNIPFAMLTGMLLDTDIFTNVNVSNGKLINDGDRMAVVGIAFPGMQDSLKLDSDKLEIPDYVEISADVTNFEMTTTMTVATNELFNEFDPEKLNSFDDLSGSLDKLTDAMNQLMNGSSQLYDGLCTLLDKSGELVAGIDKLAAGAGELKKGAGDLDTGAGKLKDGAAALSAGLNTLSSNNDTLNGGAKQVFDTLLATANSQLKAAGVTVPKLTVDNYAKTLEKVIASLDKDAVYQQAVSKVTAEVEKNRPAFEKGVTDAVKQQVMVQVTDVVKEEVTKKVTAVVYNQVAEQVIPVATKGQMTKETYDAAVAAGKVDAAVQKAIQTAIDEQMKTEAVQKKLSAAVAAQMESKEIQGMIAAQTDAQMKTQKVKALIAKNIELKMQQTITGQMASDEVQKQLAAASEGAKSIMNLKTSLDSYNSFYLGLKTYTGGVKDAAAGAAQLKAGTKDLKDGTSKLSAGANALYDGILTLKDGAPALITGITELRDGSMKLSDGLQQLNEEGIKKLTDAVDGDIAGLFDRIHAIVDASKQYNSFAGLSDDMDGQVKFIYRTDSIEAPIDSDKTEE